MVKNLSAIAALIVGFAFVPHAQAQQLAGVRVVSSCGALSPYGSITAGHSYSLTVDTSGNLCSSGGGGGGGGTSSTFGNSFPTTGTAAGFKDASGNMASGNVDSAGNLRDVPLSFHSSGNYVSAPTVTTSANHALTGFLGPNAVLKNYGTTQIAFHQAASSTTVTVATSDGIIEPGGTWEIALGSGTNIAAASVVSGAISGTGSLQVIDGTGLWSGSGGGGGSGSGGGGTSSNFTATFPTVGTAVGFEYLSTLPTLSNGNMVAGVTDANGSLNITTPATSLLATLLGAGAFSTTSGPATLPVSAIATGGEDINSHAIPTPIDPCLQAKSFVDTAHTTGTGTQLVAGVSGKVIYVCSGTTMVTSASANISLIGGTGSTCTSPTSVFGNNSASISAANGMGPFPAGQGFSPPGTTIGQTAAGASLCDLFTTTNTPTVNTHVAYVQE